jgi:hypothetical protein
MVKRRESKKRTKRGVEDALGPVRALIGRVRSRDYTIDDRKRALMYRAGLQRVLIEAREKVRGHNVREYLISLRTLTRLERIKFARQPVGHDYLRQLLASRAIPLADEINWITSRLEYENELLASHVAGLNEIQRQFASANYAACISALDGVEAALGISLWSTETRIGLLQASRGLEAQKEELARIRAIHKTGVWPYLANAASLRAEPSVSIGWFLEETRRRLERLKENEFTDYFRFKNLGIWPSTPSGCARVLRAEQSHHVVDVYETFVSYLQIATTRTNSKPVAAAIGRAQETLSQLEDSRIAKLEMVRRGNAGRDLPNSDLSLYDAILTDSNRSSSPYYRRLAKRPSSPEQAFALALATDRTTLSNATKSTNRQLAVRGLSEALRRAGYRSQKQDRADDLLRKIAHVFGSLPLARSLRFLQDAAISHQTALAITDLKLAALNSAEFGALDLLAFASHPSYKHVREHGVAGAMRDFADVISGVPIPSEPALRSDVAAFAESLRLHLAGNPDAAVARVAPALCANERVLSAQSAALALNSLARTGDVALASELIATEHVDNFVDPEALPIEDVYQGLEWRDLREAASSPPLSIALSLLRSKEGDDRLRTYRRFALETLLVKQGVVKPSELRSSSLTWAHSQVVHLLSKVCTSSMLDMLPAIGSTREVLEERREICGFLAAADRENAEQYTQEILDISRELSVLDGLKTIDGSRVHVDSESLLRSLRVDLGESFQRYAALRKQDEKPTESIATLLKDMGRKDAPPEYLLSIPVSEQDELLVSMIMRARDRFLFDIPHGLDSYLSKRVRHGSIVGVVRAPAERERVIARRNADGTYRTTDTWGDNVQDAPQRSALIGAMIATSKAIDQHLARIKDHLLHVKSEFKPLGVFDAPLTPPAYMVIRSIASTDQDVDSFIETMIRSLWAMLAHSLGTAQSILRKEAVAFVSEQFQSLRNKAQVILKSADDRAAFDAAVVAASVGMQAALITAATWFEPAESTPRTYSLDEVVDIVVASVRATVIDFEPEIELSSNASFEFSELALPAVSDLLFIALGNVAEHSGMGRSPKVRLDVEHRQDCESITFRVENEVAESRTAALKERLEAIKGEILQSKEGLRVRSEGGSGLHKLAAFVSPEKGESLSFSFEAGRFNLRVEMSYSPERPIAANANTSSR